jgi:hypothetical protein
LQDPSKFTEIVIFGLKIYHLTTLLPIEALTRQKTIVEMMVSDLAR